MELELTEFDLPSAIDNALIAGAGAGAAGAAITLGRTVDERLGDDPRRRAQGEAGAAEPAVQRGEVHAGGRPDRRRAPACATARSRSR